MTINNLGPKGHIAFDHFEGFDNTNMVEIGDEKSLYDVNSKI